MNVDYIVKIEVPTTTLKQGSTDQYEVVIGTGYPVRNGLVLTARHVLFPDDLAEDQPIKLVWKREDESELFFESVVDKIVFQDSGVDVALLVCDTSELTLPPMVLPEAGQFPEAGARWKSHGYPAVGRERGCRIKNPAGGVFHSPNPSHYIQWLNLNDNVANQGLWQGMSGAPVFDEKNRLVAVITKTPAEYLDGEGKLIPEYDGRLLATSLSYLMSEDKCDDFKTILLQPGVNAAEFLPEAKTGEQFKRYLIKKITRELKKRDQDTRLLCEQLAEELDSDDEDSQPRKIAEALAGQNTSTAINTLSVATEDCVVAGGMRYRETESVEEVKASAQQILGWLVLGSIDEKKLDSVLPHCTSHDSLFFTLAVKSLTGVEVVMARRFNRQSQFKHETGPEQRSRHLIAPPNGSLKWDEEESTRLIFLEIWNKVFRNNKRERHYVPKPEDWERLNEELAVLREDVSNPEHYYIPFKASEYDYVELAAYVSDVYHNFLSKLNQMTVIQYGEDGSDTNLFFIKEAALQAAINKFYRRINGEKG